MIVLILLRILCKVSDSKNMSNCYNLSNQKLLYEINVLDQNIHFLKCRALISPCISITGCDKLQIYPLVKHSSGEPPINDVIPKLFRLLNIPNFWIHSIENPHQHNKLNLPSTINIYLITDNIKMYVYNTLLKYLRYTDQKSVSVKLIIN
jgi:hypothetical protein